MKRRIEASFRQPSLDGMQQGNHREAEFQRDHENTQKILDNCFYEELNEHRQNTNAALFCFEKDLILHFKDNARQEGTTTKNEVAFNRDND